ncbi:MAG TPA: M23 family metallopeptidase [Gemmatimonadota bacterium]|nr:M23 family metallopeptidase [Gemmatimonadota bacterium]
MSDRFGTFMFIPHENSNVRSFRTTRRTIVGSACIAFGVLALAAGAGAWFVSGGRPGAAPAIAQENERLRTELSTLQGKTDELGQRLEDLLGREEELRLVADLPAVPVEVQAVGVGGPGHPSLDPIEIAGDRELGNRVTEISSSLDMLIRRSELVASSMEDVRKSIAAKKARFSATPSIWPASGFLSSTFSLHRRHPIFHDLRPHYGIDISARRGSPIVATASGTVVAAGWKSGHGNYVEIDHGHGIRTTYSHASRVVVTTGQDVERGDTVALVGSTGFSVAPHVHYEVHESGRPIDPLRYIFPDAIAD